MARLLVLFVLSYLAGSVPSGVVLSKLMGFPDPRTGGSGNIGATNVLRVGGKIPAFLTLLMDVAKGYVPTLLFTKFSGSLYVGFACGFFAFLGHLYPLWLGFKGGKGVATSLGVFLYVSPFSVLVLAGVFGIVLVLSGVVSLSSMVSAASLPLVVLASEKDFKLFAISILFSAFIIFKHRPNIKRLKMGEERKLFRGLIG